MSKSSYAPGELIGLIRFVFDPTQSRTLNATQAYDTNPSQIVLGSFPASATKKLLKKDLGAVEREFLLMEGTAALRFTNPPGTAANEDGGIVILGKADRRQTSNWDGPSSASVSFKGEYRGDLFVTGLTKNKKTVVARGQESTVTFGGTSAGRGFLPVDAIDKSNAAKEIYYGAFTVGTGEYREWQGKYAVLKVDLLTNNAILRVYNS
jgi:hypothetical protein